MMPDRANAPREILATCSRYLLLGLFQNFACKSNENVNLCLCLIKFLLVCLCFKFGLNTPPIVKWYCYLQLRIPFQHRLDIGENFLSCWKCVLGHGDCFCFVIFFLSYLIRYVFYREATQPQNSLPNLPLSLIALHQEFAFCSNAIFCSDVSLLTRRVAN